MNTRPSGAMAIDEGNSRSYGRRVSVKPAGNVVAWDETPRSKYVSERTAAIILITREKEL